MDNKEKFLAKIGKTNVKKFIEIFKKIEEQNFTSLDMKKLKGYKNIYRVRQGKWRIIFLIKENKTYILEIGTRGDVY